MNKRRVSPNTGLTKVRGITLLELITTMGLLAIISALAVPSMNHMMANARMSAEYDKLINLIALSQSHAGRSRKNVTLCASKDLTACTGDTNWAEGAIVCETDVCGTEVFRVKEAMSQISITGIGFTSNLEFRRTGEITGGFTRGTFVFCDDRKEAYARAIIINASGRAQPAGDALGDGTVDDHTGADVICPS